MQHSREQLRPVIRALAAWVRPGLLQALVVVAVPGLLVTALTLVPVRGVAEDAAGRRSAPAAPVAAAAAPDDTLTGEVAPRVEPAPAPVAAERVAAAPARTETASPAPPAWGSFALLGELVAPGEEARVTLRAGESFVGLAVRTPVVVIRGTRPGPTLCLTGGIHGDELNGIEIVRLALEEIEPDDLRGTMIGVPIANQQGFRRSSRYLPDRRDLNRYFPGNESGSAASRIAHAIFDGVIRYCDALVDMHSGSFHRTNVPQVRGDLRDPHILALAVGFGADAIVHNHGLQGTLRRAATEIGIPAITLEAGEPMRLQEDEIAAGVAGVWRLLGTLGMATDHATVRPRPRVYSESHWVRVDHGGILRTDLELGEWVDGGDLLGIVIDPIDNERSPVLTPYAGQVIGMALPQVVIPGFAAFHIGIEGTVPLNGSDPAEEGGEHDEMEMEERPE